MTFANDGFVLMAGMNWRISLTSSGLCSLAVRAYSFILPSTTMLTSFSLGSSQGRGPRCASWFLEHVREVAGDVDMQVMVLEGGVKGWVKGGPQFTGLMDGFKAEYWQELFAQEEGQEKEKEKEGGEAK